MIEDEALWGEFAAESEEHLDAIERLLAAGAAIERAAVDRLFRAFHSLKGMSDALGAPGMKNVAHRAEDILGLARNGRIAVAGEVAEALLDAVDALRRQRAEVIATHRDVPAPAPLLARLGTLAEGGPARPAPLPTPAAPPPRAAGAPLLGALASRCAAASPMLAALLDGRAPEGLREATDLADGARLLGLARLATAFEEFSAAAGSTAALPALGRLRRLLGALEEEAGEPAGPPAAPPGGEAAALGPRLAGLAMLVEGLTAGGDAETTAAAAAEAAAVAAAFGVDPLEHTLLLLADLAERATDPDAAAVLAKEGPSLAERLRTAAEGGAGAIRATAEPEALAESADPRIPAAFAPLLGAEGRRRVIAALDGGRALYRLRMATLVAPEAEAAVAAVLAAEAEVLTSRTRLDGDPSHLDMLVAGPPEIEALSRALTAADPPRQVVLDLAPVEAASAEVAALARAAPATMRVRQETIDGIIALEAEVRAAALALAEALDEGAAAEAIATLAGLERRLTGAAARGIGGALARLRGMQEALERAENRLAVGMRRLDDAVMELRVVPVGTLLARLPRVVRAVAQSSAKDVELVLEGEEVTIDRSLVELLADPLLHLVRNAVDHGVEPPAARQAAGKPRRATLRVSAARRTGQVRVRVSDDGRGIDRARVLARALSRGLVTPEAAERLTEEEIFALLFRPGFSTADTVTETSGRGVGLDVVQDAVRRAGGTVEIASTPGKGTAFTLRLPLTAAVQPVLLVELAGRAYALPAARVDAVLEEGAAPGCEVVSLADILGVEGRRAAATVILRSAGRSFGLAVDRVQRRTDLLLRPLHPSLAALPSIGGVGVLGNGEPVVVLEPDGIAPAFAGS